MLKFHAMSANIEFILNGEPRQAAASASIEELLASLGLAGKRVAVEMNGEIVPKSRHAEVCIAAGCRIEIVVAVGGG